MDKQKILHLIDQPQLISETDLERLEEIVATYPYFQVAHLLIAKYTQDKESMLAPQKIRRAASYALDRNQLRKFILNNTTNGEASLKLKTHFEAIDDDTPKMQSVFEETTDFNASTEKKPIQENLEISFFDVIESETSQEETTTQLEEENITEAHALECFHEGKVEEAEKIFKQLVLLYPEKASYYYKQLAVLTDKEEYTQLAKAHQPAEEKAAEPFFENIPPSSLSETETLINQTIENPAESQSFFEGIAQNENTTVAQDAQTLDEETKKITVEDSKSEEDTATLHTHQATSTTHETTENTSFFDQLEGESEEADAAIQENLTSTNNKKTKEKEVDKLDFQALISRNPILPNQATEDAASYFAALEAVEDIHAIERTPETDPFEALRKDAQAPETEEPFEIKPEPKPDTSFFDELKEEDTPPSRTGSYLDDDLVEPKAIYFVNQGRNKEAIEVYEQLLERNPQKASYYLSQINVIKNLELEQKPALKPTKNPAPEPKVEEEPSSENMLNERLAIQLFNDGKLEEAIDIYNQLKAKEKREDKIAYYNQQIAILKS